MAQALIQAGAGKALDETMSRVMEGSCDRLYLRNANSPPSFERAWKIGSYSTTCRMST